MQKYYLSSFKMTEKSFNANLKKKYNQLNIQFSCRKAFGNSMGVSLTLYAIIYRILLNKPHKHLPSKPQLKCYTNMQDPNSKRKNIAYRKRIYSTALYHMYVYSTELWLM